MGKNIVIIKGLKLFNSKHFVNHFKDNYFITLIKFLK